MSTFKSDLWSDKNSAEDSRSADVWETGNDKNSSSFYASKGDHLVKKGLYIFKFKMGI